MKQRITDKDLKYFFSHADDFDRALWKHCPVDGESYVVTVSSIAASLSDAYKQIAELEARIAMLENPRHDDAELTVKLDAPPAGMRVHSESGIIEYEWNADEMDTP